jgi:putative heme transporter
VSVETEQPAGEGRKRWLKRGVAGGLGVAVIFGTYVFVLPQFANYGAVWDQVKTLSWEWILVLLGAVVLNLATFAPPWMAALPGLRFLQAETVTQASTAGTYLAPGGPAVGIGLSAAMLLGWGFHADEVALAVTLTGIWNQLAILSFPAVALALLTLTGGNGTALQTIASIGLIAFLAVAAAFAAALWSSKMARRVGDLAARLANRALRLVRRGPVDWDGQSFVHFRNSAIGLLRRRWHVLTLATLAGQLTVFLVLLASLRALGVGADEVSVIEVFAAWSLARVLGSIPITPGGLGVVELGLTTVLAGFGGNNAGVVAAVLLYRFLTIVPTLALGAAAGATWRRQRGPEPAAASSSPDDRLSGSAVEARGRSAEQDRRPPS